MALPTKLTLHIVSPDTSISHEVDEVSLPGSEGDFGVLPGHTPFFTALRTGHDVVPAGRREALPGGGGRLRRSAAGFGDGAGAGGRARRGSRRGARRGGHEARRGSAERRRRTRSTSSARGWPCCGRCSSCRPKAPQRRWLTFRNLASAVPIPRAHPDARRPRSQSALPRFGPRVLLVLLQPAAAAADLHLRVHEGAAGRASDRRWSRTRCSCSAASCRGRGSPRRCSSRPTR